MRNDPLSPLMIYGRRNFQSLSLGKDGKPPSVEIVQYRIRAKIPKRFALAKDHQTIENPHCLETYIKKGFS